MGWPQRSSDRRRRRSGKGTPSVLFNGTDTSINAGSEASIDDLADNAFTADGWFRSDGLGETNGVYFEKGNLSTGWYAINLVAGSIQAEVLCDTTDARSRSAIGSISITGEWAHFALFYDDAGDRKVYMAIGGIWETAYTMQTAGIGAIVSDAGDDLIIGNRADGARTFDGAIGWNRISDNDRYNHGVDFTPPPRSAPPANDANTVRLFKMDEGKGTVIGDSSTNAQDATLSNGIWIFT